MKPINNQYLHDEWLVTNGIGGYGCSSISGAPTRRYHSLLNAALPIPYGRTLMLNYVNDTLMLPDKSEKRLSSLRHRNEEKDCDGLIEFQLINGIPHWIYTFGEIVLQKTLFLIHRQNTVHISYKLLSPLEGLELKWQPFFHFRANDQPVDAINPDELYTVYAKDAKFEIKCPGFPSLNIFNSSNTLFSIHSETLTHVFYELEAERGYSAYGSLNSPVFFSVPLSYNQRTTFIVSTEPWKTILSLSPKEAWLAEKVRKRNLLKAAGPIYKNPIIGKLIFAADQFVFTPTTRFKDMIRMQAMGEEVSSVIAGYPWFGDWGRDTMISLEGLTLSTGRYHDANAILHTFAHYIRNGLIPNMFPEGEHQGIYNTADATLWFFHAIDRYIEITGDHDILEFVIPKLDEVIECHIKGTDFGIKMDKDGLLTQGHPEIQLTWMDAKVGNWVVTPRRGKAVEINGLWYNALKLYERWTGKNSSLSERCFASFNQKFWFSKGEYLFDVIEGEQGNDASIRPNQLFAISLRYPVLEENKWTKVFNCVKKELYTPVGLKTLSEGHPEFKTTYDGDLRARDAAYHQGTVWPWLLGPYIDVWLKLYPNDFNAALEILKDLEQHLDTYGLGSIAEIFDATPPFKARGCFAQAWSVAEILRIYTKILK